MSVRRKRRPAAVALTTSMGDIAFLLIIFFILASIPKTGRDLKLAEAPRLDELEGELSVTMDTDGVCWLNNSDVPVPVEALEGLIREELTRRKEGKLVIVKIDRALPFENYSKVFTAVSNAGGTIGATGVEAPR